MFWIEITTLATELDASGMNLAEGRRVRPADDLTTNCCKPTSMAIS